MHYSVSVHECSKHEDSSMWCGFQSNLFSIYIFFLIFKYTSAGNASYVNWKGIPLTCGSENDNFMYLFWDLGGQNGLS